MATPVELILIGAGQRGAAAYASYALAHPDEVRFVAVAEPDAERRAAFAADHGLDPARCFSSWEALLAEPQLGQGALVATQDQMHVAPAVAAMERGYDVLLEKPMAHTLAGCVELVATAERTGRVLQICHVLRYSPFWRTLHEIVQSGRLGDIVTIEHRENVAYWHMAHSFVRGHWRNATLSSPMILAKCCHDLDILLWNTGQAVRRLASFGSLQHFRADQIGDEIPARCTDGCPIEAECQYSAIGIYLEHRHLRGKLPFNPLFPAVWPYTVLGSDQSLEGRRRALETGPYGRCVYRCDNDVPDHQVVSMEMADGSSIVLVMHGHSHEEHRSMRYDGTRATLRARFGAESAITIHEHGGSRVEVPIPPGGAGHGGGDHGLMRDFVRVLRGEIPPLTTARVALESHLLAFAAEEARLAGQVIHVEEFRARAHAA